MEFRLEFNPPALPELISLQDRLFLIGSCFTEQMGQKLENHLFTTLQNPSGILFNPISICTSIEQYLNKKHFNESDLFYHNELWGSWDHHTRFSSPSQQVCLHKINNAISDANLFLQTANWMIITLGSAFVYKKEGKFVANCHKVPTDKFEKILLSVEDLTDRLSTCINQLKVINPDIKILFTISPVRHLRDGFVENNRSKANLIIAVQQITLKFNQVYYFPAYELIIDDLRDYRFFAEDMVHPNYAATNYVWEKFTASALTSETRDILKEIAILNNSYNHKPFNPNSDQHKRFMDIQLQRVLELKKAYPYLNMEHFINKFSQQ